MVPLAKSPSYKHVNISGKNAHGKKVRDLQRNDYDVAVASEEEEGGWTTSHDGAVQGQPGDKKQNNHIYPHHY